MEQTINQYMTLTDDELQDINGGYVQAVLIGGAILVGTPFVLGAIAGAADEYARKHGHH